MPVSVEANKRSFLKLALLGVSIASLYSFSWNKAQADTLALLQEDLFPDIDAKLNTRTINARSYLAYILHHPRVSKDDKRFIKKGVVWLDEEASDLFGAEYRKLPEQKRQKVLANIAKTEWGESYIETILTYLFESLFGDPIYGINKDEVGWKWVHHTPGLPRPTIPL